MKKVNYKSLPEKTADVLSDMLYRENYRVGMKLPNELELAERLEDSRNTVRKAVHILEERQLLEVRRGSGTFVSARLGMSDDPLGFSAVCDKNKLVRDLLDIRLMIEPRIASLAAEYASGSEIEHLRSICREMEILMDKGDKYYEKDMEFHIFIAGCSKNLVVHNLLPYIHQAIILQENVDRRRMGKKTMDAHWRIFKAIEGRHCSEAEEAMRAHLIQNRERILRVQEETEKKNKFV